MPYEITLDKLPAGYAAHAARGPGYIEVIAMEFTSTEDGDLFISRLDGYPTTIINKLPVVSGATCSTADNLLAVIRKDKTATVYFNELKIIAYAQSKKDFKKGEYVYTDDIADIKKIKLKDITIPEDAGIVFVFSCGWRKGLFYDLIPLSAEPYGKNRDYELEVILGQLYSYLFFQDIFKIVEKEWEAFFEQQWFPFITLKTSTIKGMINHIRAGWNIDDKLDDIVNEITNSHEKILKKWKNLLLFNDHYVLLEKAFERFLAKDYISATSILYPRIEGIMRACHLQDNSDTRASQSSLIKASTQVDKLKYFRFSMLLPDKFSQYLEQIYFRNFDPKNPCILSRHSFAHGVAPVDVFSLKGATLGILIIEQLSFFMNNKAKGDI